MEVEGLIKKNQTVIGRITKVDEDVLTFVSSRVVEDGDVWDVEFYQLVPTMPSLRPKVGPIKKIAYLGEFNEIKLIAQDTYTAKVKVLKD